MPIPIIIAIAAALGGGGIAGALARQPEVNRLKQQVKQLQEELNRLQRVIKEQDRQIRELKIRYNALKAYNFTERQKQKSRLKGTMMFQYAFKEYMDLLVVQVGDNNYSLGKEETIFFNAFERLVNGIQITIEEKMLIREWVRSKYAYEVDNFVEAQMDDIVEKVESLHVA